MAERSEGLTYAVSRCRSGSTPAEQYDYHIGLRTNDIDVIAYNELSIASLTWVIMKQSDHRMAVRGAVERGGEARP